VSARNTRARSQQHLWEEAVLHLARLGRSHFWRTTVGVDWLELRDPSRWIALQFLPGDAYAVRTGPADADQPDQEFTTESYARALEAVEQLAARQ
jgi:hypothetical protein